MLFFAGEERITMADRVKIGMLKAIPKKWNVAGNWAVFVRKFEAHAGEKVALITDPRGEVAAKLQSNLPDVLIHEIDLKDVSDENHLDNRRPEFIAAVDHSSRQPEVASPKYKQER